MLQFKDYSKYYGDSLVLQIPQLELPHDIYWLKGENGSGKTTLIKSIAGLIPFNGSIAIDNLDLNQNRTGYRLAVNYAEAEPAYPPFLTGNDLIKFYKTTKKATDKQVSELIASLGIESYAGNKIGTYSSGMAKKLSLVLGFMGQPKLILLDEPLITLDQQSVSTLQSMIESYHDSGVCIFITSHQEIDFGSRSARRLSITAKNLAAI